MLIWKVNNYEHKKLSYSAWRLDVRLWIKNKEYRHCETFEGGLKAAKNREHEIKQEIGRDYCFASFFLSVPDTAIARKLAEWSRKQELSGNPGAPKTYTVLSVKFTGENYHPPYSPSRTYNPVIPIDVYLLDSDYSLIQKWKFNPNIE